MDKLHKSYKGRVVAKDRGRPEYGKVYALTGGKNTPSIANGNTWAESEVNDEHITESERYDL